MATEPGDQSKLSDGAKERLKLTANFLNVLGAGTVITGGVAPLAAAIFKTAPIPLSGAFLGTVICLAIGLVLHFAARSLLKRLDR